MLDMFFQVRSAKCRLAANSVSPIFAKAPVNSSVESCRAGRISVIRRYRSEMLLVAYIGTILLSPLGDSNPDASELLAVLTLILLLAGASYMVSRRIATTVILPIAFLWLVSRTIGAFGYRHPGYAHFSPVVGILLSVIVLAAILRRLASPPMVTTGVIAEAFIGYLILASVFGEVFWMLNHLIGNPFNQPIGDSQVSTMQYFSMVTITSLAYGGIAPINPYVRLLAALESMLGIFYVAVIVARLASYFRSSNSPME